MSHRAQGPRERMAVMINTRRRVSEMRSKKRMGRMGRQGRKGRIGRMGRREVVGRIGRRGRREVVGRIGRMGSSGGTPPVEDMDAALLRHIPQHRLPIRVPGHHQRSSCQHSTCRVSATLAMSRNPPQQRFQRARV
eukprot:976211-Rhodomonas_salina.4